MGTAGRVGGCRGVAKKGRVDLGGFEPPTFTMPWCCATELRYRPNFGNPDVSRHRLGVAQSGRPSPRYPVGYGRAVRPPGDREEVAGPLGRGGHLRGRQRRPPPPYYVLCMYPYPSGPAHQGHVRNYTFGDLLVRHRTMQGYAVLQPVRLRLFGLPAENAAIKTGTHPRIFTEARIAELKASLTRLGAVYDWRREIRSHDPEYIKWNQVIFRALPGGRPGLPQMAPVNWCPGCQTVLANEQVLADGTCERSGDVVDQAGPRAVVLPHHRLRRRAARRPRRPGLARAGQDHAAQLDRPLRGRRVRPARRRARRTARSGSSPPGPTPASA